MPSAVSSRRLPEPFAFFVDRSLGARTVVDGLRRNSLPEEVVHAHDQHFAQNTTDAEWLEEVGRRGWVVLSKDIRIQTNAVERQTVMSAGVALFALGRGDHTGERMEEIFASALDRIRTCLRRFETPLVAIITGEGSVRVRVARGIELAKPVVYAARRKPLRHRKL